MRHDRAGCGGFTLIELLIVMVVIAVVSTLAAPALNEMLAKSAVKGAANELFADLHYARSESVQRNTTVTLTMNAGGYAVSSGGTTLKTVTLSGPSITGGATGTVVFSPTRATAAVTNLPVTVGHTLTAATLQINVNTLGRAEICTPSGAMTGYTAC